MKRIVPFLIAIFISTASSAQIITKIEGLMYKPGSAIKIDRKYIGTYQQLQLAKITVEDLVTKQKASGVEMTALYSDKSVNGFVDSDELPALIKILEIFRDNRISITNSTSYYFSSKGGIKAEFTLEDKNPVAMISIRGIPTPLTNGDDVLRLLYGLQK